MGKIINGTIIGLTSAALIGASRHDEHIHTDPPEQPGSAWGQTYTTTTSATAQVSLYAHGLSTTTGRGELS